MEHFFISKLLFSLTTSRYLALKVLPQEPQQYEQINDCRLSWNEKIYQPWKNHKNNLLIKLREFRLCNNCLKTGGNAPFPHNTILYYYSRNIKSIIVKSLKLHTYVHTYRYIPTLTGTTSLKVQWQKKVSIR